MGAEITPPDIPRSGSITAARSAIGFQNHELRALGIRDKQQQRFRFRVLANRLVEFFDGSDRFSIDLLERCLASKAARCLPPSWELGVCENSIVFLGDTPGKLESGCRSPIPGAKRIADPRTAVRSNSDSFASTTEDGMEEEQ